MREGDRISAKLGKFQPSLTLRLKTLAERRRSRGLPLYDFGLGETKGELAAPIRDAAIRAYSEGRTMYGDPAGIPELREQVLKWLYLADAYNIDQVVITTGAKQSLFNILLAICNPSDCILLDAAPWVSYQPLAVASYAVPIMVLPSRGESSHLRVNGGDLERNLRMRPEVKLFLLNSPVNPTAQVYEADELCELLDVCARYGVYMVLDRLYWRLVYDGKSYPEPQLTPDLRRWLIQVDGISKNFRRTGGLRIGWTVAPADVAAAMVNLQSHYTSGPSVPSQWGALAAISGDYDYEMRDELEGLRNRIYAARDRLAPVKIWDSPGAFYSFWDVRECFGKRVPSGKVIGSSIDVAEYLLEHAGVVTAPGSAFLQEGFLRLSFAVPPDQLDAGLEAAAGAIGELR